MQQSNQRAHKSEPNESGIADRANGRDTPEQNSTQKTDSRDIASHSERTQIGTSPSTSTAGPQADNTVRACPECDTTGICRRAKNKMRGRPAQAKYACSHCGATFDEPIERDRYADNGDPGYLAGELAKADPDAVSADHVGEPMTDGGMTDTAAANMVGTVLDSAWDGMTPDQRADLNAVEDYLRNDTSADYRHTDTRIEAASKLRTLSDDLEHAARHSVADHVDVSVYVTVEETFRGSWGDD